MHLEQLTELHDAQAGRAEGRRREGTPQEGGEVRKKERQRRREKKPLRGEEGRQQREAGSAEIKEGAQPQHPHILPLTAPDEEGIT